MQKKITNISKFQFDQESGRNHFVDMLPPKNYSFIYLIPIIFFSNIITMRAYSWNFPASLTRYIIQYIKCYISFPFYGHMACDAFSLLENEN